MNSINPCKEIILRTSGLTKKFKSLVAVRDLNLEVHRGDIFGFLGPNGAGKSTTIRMMLGLIRPTSGWVELFNRPLHKNRKQALKKIGALVEKPDFYNYLSARRNLEISATLIGGITEKAIAQALELVGLLDRADDKVKTYSHGMKQRLGIAQALLGNPELVVLDEPTIGLDPQGMKEVRDLIVRLAEQGMTVFLSSHLLHEVEQICTHAAIIHRGQLIVQGEVKALLQAGTDSTVVQVDRPIEAQTLLQAQNWIDSVDLESNRLIVKLPPGKIPRMNALLVSSGFQVSALHPQRTLEDYFLSIVGGDYA